MSHRAPIVLTIAGSDSSGGAGIQGDIKTFSALGVYSASVITSVTAQNTHTITMNYPLPAEVIEAQLVSVFEDLNIVAIKIGMLATVEAINAVSRIIKKYPGKSIVVDPVLISSSGTYLLETEAYKALKDTLFPLASLITPNLPEAAALLDESEARDEHDMRDVIKRLNVFGAKAVLLKGGHLPGKVCHDLLLSDGQISQFSHPRIQTANTHGTGCTLSSAITAGLAKGQSLRQAVESAREYLQGALQSASQLDVGGGHGPVHHFYQYWQQGKEET